MTLGATPTPAQIVAELGQSFPYTFPDARTRWLADVGAGASIIFPTSFANKTALKVPTTTGPSGSSTSHTFTGVDFGPEFTNRRLLCYIIAHGKTAGQAVSGAITITNFTVGGVAGAVGALDFWSWSGSTASAIFSGVQSDSFNPSGTSGTVSFTTSIALNCSVIVFSMIGPINTPLTPSNGYFSNSSPISGTLDLQNDTTLITVGVQNSAATLTMSGCTKRSQFSPVAGYQCVIGYDNHLATQLGRAISITGSAGATAMILDGWIR